MTASIAASSTPPRVPGPATAATPIRVAWPVALLVAALSQAAGGVARAQDLEEAEAAAVVRNNFELAEANFHQWIFGTAMVSRSAPDHLELLLALSLADVGRSCSLSAAQERKLRLAGRGDIKRFLDSVAEAREVFLRCRHDPNKINEIRRETQPLAAALGAGLFGEGSFFAKTLGATLDPEQAARHRAALRERARFRYRAKVSLALANLDAVLGLTAEQYRRLVDVVLEETTPPRAPAGPFEASVVLVKIARLPESTIRPIFDDAQWKTLSRELRQARGMEPSLRANGYLEEDGPENPPRGRETDARR